jgi:Ser/Thr protein kinase RdoA (MazF antagonist)
LTTTSPTPGIDLLPFERLAHRGKVRRLRRLARRALDEYGLGDARFTLLRHAAWGTTFRVDVASPRGRYVLRVHGPDVTNVAEARSELLWLAALRRDTDLGVPEPVTTPDGALAVTVRTEGVPGPRDCVLLRWLEGSFFSHHAGLRTIHQVGQFMARLHLHAERFAPPPGFTRRRMNPDDALRDWSPEVLGEGGLSTAAVATAVGAAQRLHDEARTLTPTPATFGLIHADLHLSNLLVHHGTVRAIDFGDCAFGYFAYDIAVWLVALAKTGWSDQEEKRAAFFAGYGSVRPLPPDQATQIDHCMAWRRLEDLDWDAETVDHPRFRAWLSTGLPELIRALRRYADGAQMDATSEPYRPHP